MHSDMFCVQYKTAPRESSPKAKGTGELQAVLNPEYQQGQTLKMTNMKSSQAVTNNS